MNKTLITISLLLASLNACANKVYDDCISINKPRYHKMINEGMTRAQTDAFFQKIQKECIEEASTDKHIKHGAVYKQCIKDQRSYYHNLQASGRLETKNINIAKEWDDYCKLEADTKVHPNIYKVRLHGVIDPKVSSAKGGLESDVNQAKKCWVKNPPPICNKN